MKTNQLLVPVLVALTFIGCGDSGSTTTPNTNTYDLKAVNLTKAAAALLKGGYSNGITGSISYIRSDNGTDYVNGIATTNIKILHSTTLNNGYTSQSYRIDKQDSDGITLETIDNDGIICSLTSQKYAMPTNATVGAVSPSTLVATCTDGTYETSSWKLIDAGNGNAYYIVKSVTTGAYQSETEVTVTISSASKPTYYKIFTDIIANDINATFEGAVN